MMFRIYKQFTDIDFLSRLILSQLHEVTTRTSSNSVVTPMSTPTRSSLARPVTGTPYRRILHFTSLWNASNLTSVIIYQCKLWLCGILCAAMHWLSLHCVLAVAQCIVIGPVCGWVCLWVCYHDNSKLHALILTKLGL